MQTKLFIGTRATHELKIRLNSVTDFQLIPYKGKEYVGLFVQEAYPTVQHLRNQCDQFTACLQKYLPDLRADTLPIVAFPQLLLG